jgi:hypothetical protein
VRGVVGVCRYTHERRVRSPDKSGRRRHVLVDREDVPHSASCGRRPTEFEPVERMIEPEVPCPGLPSPMRTVRLSSQVEKIAVFREGSTVSTMRKRFQ